MSDQEPQIKRNFGTAPEKVRYSNSVAMCASGDEQVLDFFHFVEALGEVTLQCRVVIPKSTALRLLKDLPRQVGVDIPGVTWPEK